MTTSNNSPFKEIGIKKFIPAIIWFFVVLTLISIPGDDLPKVDNWMIAIDYDKLIHIGVFGLLALLFMYPFGKSTLPSKLKLHYFIRFALATIVWGYTTEVLQKFYIPGRSYDLADWLADSIGGMGALVFCWFRFLRRSNTHK